MSVLAFCRTDRSLVQARTHTLGHVLLSSHGCTKLPNRSCGTGSLDSTHASAPWAPSDTSQAHLYGPLFFLFEKHILTFATALGLSETQL